MDKLKISDPELHASLTGGIDKMSWIYPVAPDEFRISSFDSDKNPLVIDYYVGGVLKFNHTMTYDGDGDILTFKLT